MEINTSSNCANNNVAFSVEPAFGEDAVAIMLATNNDFAPYAGVMIQSIKDNTSKDRNYDIVVVGDLSDINKKLLESMAGRNIAIRVVDMKPLLENVDLSIFSTNLYYTVETYYRFFIPQLYCRYEKVLYLDADMVALRDVAELFDTDMENNWWAVTRDGITKRSDAWAEEVVHPYLKKTLKMDSAFDYFQAGVMIWNIPQCIKDNVHEQLIDRLKEIKTPKWVDQCVMNSLANGKHIRWIHGKWNALWYAFLITKDATAYNEMMRLLDDPYIIHFCTATKPWDEPDRPNADKFWHYARKTPFYETILLNMLSKKIATNVQAGTGNIRTEDTHEIPPHKRTRFYYNKYRLLASITFGALHRKYNTRRKAVKKALGIK